MNKNVKNQIGNSSHLGNEKVYFMFFFFYLKRTINQVRDNPMETQKVEKICLKHLFKNSEVRRLEDAKEKYNRFNTCSWNPLMLFYSVLFSESQMSVNQEITNEANKPCGQNNSYQNCRDQETETMKT